MDSYSIEGLGQFKKKKKKQKNNNNKALDMCILSLKIMETIYLYDWVPLIRFSLFTSIITVSNISIIFHFSF